MSLASHVKEGTQKSSALHVELKKKNQIVKLVDLLLIFRELFLTFR